MKLAVCGTCIDEKKEPASPRQHGVAGRLSEVPGGSGLVERGRCMGDGVIPAPGEGGHGEGERERPAGRGGIRGYPSGTLSDSGK